MDGLAHDYPGFAGAAAGIQQLVGIGHAFQVVGHVHGQYGHIRVAGQLKGAVFETQQLAGLKIHGAFGKQHDVDAPVQVGEGALHGAVRVGHAFALDGNVGFGKHYPEQRRLGVLLFGHKVKIVGYRGVHGQNVHGGGVVGAPYIGAVAVHGGLVNGFGTYKGAEHEPTGPAPLQPKGRLIKPRMAE